MKALDLWAQQGYEGTPVSQIVDECGVTKPTLYHYFGSKQGLLAYLFDTLGAHWLEEVRKAAHYERNLPLTLETITSCWFKESVSGPQFIRLVIAIYFSGPQSQSYRTGKAWFETLEALIVSVFTQAVADHGSIIGREHQFAYTFIGMLLTYSSLYLHGKVNLDEQSSFAAVKQYSVGIYS